MRTLDSTVNLQQIAEAIMAMGSMSPNFTGSGMRGTGMASSRQPGGAFRSPTPSATPATGGPPNGMVYGRSPVPSQQPTGGPPPGMVYNQAGGGMGASSPGMTGAFDPTGTLGFKAAQTPNGGWSDSQPAPPSFGGGGGMPFEGNGASPNGMPAGMTNSPGPGMPTGGQVIHGRSSPAGDVFYGSGAPGTIGGDAGGSGLWLGPPTQIGGQQWGQNLPGQGQPYPNIPAGAAASSFGGGFIGGAQGPGYMGGQNPMGAGMHNVSPLPGGSQMVDDATWQQMQQSGNFPSGAMGAPQGGGGQPYAGMTNRPGPTMPGQPSIADLQAGGGTPMYRTPAGSNGSQPQTPQYMGPPQYIGPPTQSAGSLAQAASFWNPAVRFPWQQIQQGQYPQQTPDGYPINY